jgi:phytoene dehydrogenase-like protein
MLNRRERGEVNGEHGMWGYVRGGTGRISFAMVASAGVHGAVIRTNSPVPKMLVHIGGISLSRIREVMMCPCLPHSK